MFTEIVPVPSALREAPVPGVFDGIVQPHVRCMVQAARRILRSEDLAWDAVQETLICVWRRGLLPAEPRGVLLRLIVPRSLHVLRTIGRRRRHEERVPTPGGGGGTCVDPSCELEQRELRDRLDRAIASLATPLRDAFVLREVGGLDYEAIAVRLGVPVGTVRSRIHRARRTLRDRLARLTPHSLARAGAGPFNRLEGESA